VVAEAAADHVQVLGAIPCRGQGGHGLCIRVRHHAVGDDSRCREVRFPALPSQLVVRFPHQCPQVARARQVHAAQVRLGQVRVPQARPAQIRAAQVRAAQVRAAQVRATLPVVDVVWDPPWSPDRIGQAGLDALGAPRSAP